MSKRKYEFHPELKSYENQKMPVIPILVPVLQRLMKVLYRMEKSEETINVSEVKIPAEDGTLLRTLVYSPVDIEENDWCMVFFHGGGFAYQSAPHHFALARRFAKELHCKVFLVDYRLAPKYKFPTAPEDCFCIYQWIVKYAEDLKVDKRKIVVCGDSAGGNLAAVICLMARDKGVQMPCAQVLLYPVTDRRMITDSAK